MFAEQKVLRIPGPTPIAPRIARAGARPMINHRGSEFSALLARVQSGLQHIFQTQEDVIPLTASGTAGMEAIVANLTSPGDPVLVLVGGKFGERWAELARAYRCDVRELPYTWGRGVEPDAVRAALAEFPAQVVFATQNESSTAVYNDIPALATVCREAGALLAVDAISSMGGAPFYMDAWGVDAVVTSSQKCLMTPPGLAFVALGRRAWARAQQTTSPRYYLDLAHYRKAAAKGETPYTPGVSLFFALDEALTMIQEEGLEASWSRHRLMQQMIRQGAQALGLDLFVPDQWASPTVTAILAPEGVDIEAVRKQVAARRGVVLSGGQDRLKGKIFRVGHMGYAGPLDMIAVLAAIEIELLAAGFHCELGAGVRAAQEVWAGWR